MVLGSDLRGEAKSLRLLIDDLEARLTALENRIAEEDREDPPPQLCFSPGAREAPNLPVASRGPSSSASYTVISSRVPATEPDQELREEAARQTGRFFDRALRGVTRGPSGRERVNLANRCYVLVRDRHNIVHDPVIVFQRFSDLRPHVSQNGGFADSIFAGFSSAWEAEIATHTAGLAYPANFH